MPFLKKSRDLQKLITDTQTLTNIARALKGHPLREKKQQRTGRWKQVSKKPPRFKGVSNAKSDPGCSRPGVPEFGCKDQETVSQGQMISTFWQSYSGHSPLLDVSETTGWNPVP